MSGKAAVRIGDAIDCGGVANGGFCRKAFRPLQQFNIIFTDGGQIDLPKFKIYADGWKADDVIFYQPSWFQEIWEIIVNSKGSYK